MEKKGKKYKIGNAAPFVVRIEGGKGKEERR